MIGHETVNKVRYLIYCFIFFATLNLIFSCATTDNSVSSSTSTPTQSSSTSTPTTTTLSPSSAAATETTSPTPPYQQSTDVLDTVMEHIYTHLEYNGYKIKKNEKYISVTHHSKWNFILKKYNGGILVNGNWTANENAKINRSSYLELINTLNISATVTRFYADKDNDMTFETWINDYERNKFISLFDQFIKDTSGMDKAKYKEFLKFVK